MFTNLAIERGPHIVVDVYYWIYRYTMLYHVFGILPWLWKPPFSYGYTTISFLAELHIFSASLDPSDGCQAFVQALKDGKQRPGCVAGLVFFFLGVLKEIQIDLCFFRLR